MRKFGGVPVILKRRNTVVGEYAEEIVSYGDAEELSLILQPARGRLLFEQYGERLNYMKNCFCEPSLNIVPGDGVWFLGNENETPDYVVVSVFDWLTHKAVLLEKTV